MTCQVLYGARTLAAAVIMGSACYATAGSAQAPDGPTRELRMTTADEFARETLLPAAFWTERSSADLAIEDVQAIAAEAGVHPAIVAGRWRWENQDYRRFSKLIGRNEVRSQFG